MKKFKTWKSYCAFISLLCSFLITGCGGDGGTWDESAATTKAITAYSFVGLPGAAGTINEPAKTIAVTVPFGTDRTALVATFTTTGTGVTVVAVPQTSGTTANNFTSPVAYTVTAEDGTTATYTVTVTVASPSAKAITAYSFVGYTGATGTINEPAKTIAVTVPFGTDRTALVATFTTTGTIVEIDAEVQTSAATTNDFTDPVTYMVTAADFTTADYIVTVTVAPSSAKAITAYSFAGLPDSVETINELAQTIAVTVLPGTNVTALVATFTTTGTIVEVVDVVQTSAATANNFTTPVTYTVTAADSTFADYIVTVTEGLGRAPVDLGTAGNFVILTKSGITTTGVTAITGDIGVSPIDSTAITGFGLTMDASNTFSTSALVTGKVYAADYTEPTPTNMTTAISDLRTAYVDAAGRTTPDDTELGGGDISGMTLAPGLYKWGTGVLITNVGVTLSGGANDVWIFQIADDLTVNNAAIVTLAGGAQAKNIFWQVGGGVGVSLGTTVQFQGIILATKAITINTGATLNGRALAETKVTLDANTITAP